MRRVGAVPLRLRVAAAAAAALLMAAGAPTELPAQAGGEGDGASPPGSPAWLRAWSPLQPVGTLPRALPEAAGLAPELLLLPAPRAGLFWTAGNPAGLRDEIDGRRVLFSAGLDRREGAYRRPLDPGAVERRGAEALAWGPLGGDGAGIGRVRVERVGREAPAHGMFVTPDVMSPLAVLDTLGHASTTTVAHLEAAGSWRLGRLALGLAPGYRAEQARTDVSPVPVRTRTAGPGVRAGASYRLSSDLRIGAHGGWQGLVHSISSWAVSGSSTIYELTGFQEPVPIRISSASPPTAYSRRLERDAWSAGVSVTGRTGEMRWAAFGRAEAEATDRLQSSGADPIADRWEADGWRAGVAATRPLGERLRLAADLRYGAVTGELFQENFEEPVFVTDEQRLRLEAELRLDAGRGWTLGGRLLALHEDRVRRDRLVQARHRIDAWTSGVAVGAARRVGSGLSVGLGAGAMRHAPTGTLPFPGQMNPVYEEWVAPGALVHGMPATSWVTGATLLWEKGPGTAFWLRGGYDALSPSLGSRVPASLPEGSRRGVRVSVGALLTGGE